MGTNATRLERFLAEQLGDCCGGDVDARVETLDALSESVPDDGADLATLST